jgi:hypothetical protein
VPFEEHRELVKKRRDDRRRQRLRGLLGG